MISPFFAETVLILAVARNPSLQMIIKSYVALGFVINIDNMFSNAFPQEIKDTADDLVLNVGQDQIVTLTGTNFTPDSSVSIDGVPLFGIPSPYTVVNSTTITLDPPLVPTLGAKPITVTNAFGTANGILNFAANDPPAIQAGDGEEPVTFIGSVGLTIAGTPGSLFFLGLSTQKIPSVLPGVVDMEIGNNFTNLFQIGGAIAIPAAGHVTITIPGTNLQPLTTFFLEGVTFEPVPSLPLPDSNSQELQFLF